MRNYALTEEDQAYIRLAAAILRQAYIDYIDTLLMRPMYMRHKVYRNDIATLEAFFNSDYANRISLGHAVEVMDRAYETAISLIKTPRSRGTHSKTFYKVRERTDKSV